MSAAYTITKVIICIIVLSSDIPITLSVRISLFFFFFQAEDGIRDLTVTGVQTCALPISIDIYVVPAERIGEKHGAWLDWRPKMISPSREYGEVLAVLAVVTIINWFEIGRASCRERV